MEFNRPQYEKAGFIVKSAVMCEPSPLNGLLSSTTSFKGEVVTKLISDVSVLCNQKRLDALGTGAVQSYLDSLGHDTSNVDDNLTDEQRMTLIRPRSCQTLSELSMWSDMVQNYIDEHKLQNVVNAPTDEQPTNEPSSNEQPSNDNKS